MHPSVSLTIPQPCHENWAAMNPATAGRHCAACQKTVVDFTRQSDAEILAYLAQAVGGRTCGRFAAGQLERPLQRAAPAAPTRWRTWLAAAAAVWGLREIGASDAAAQAPVDQRPAAKQRIIRMGMVAAAPQNVHKALPEKPVQARELRGVVLDATTGEGLPGATVLLTGTNVGVSTDQHGAYVLPLRATQADVGAVTLKACYIGYVSQVQVQTLDEAASPQIFKLQTDVKGMMGAVVTRRPSVVPPAPWRPRAFYYWGKYWLTRPFQGN